MTGFIIDLRSLKTIMLESATHKVMTGAAISPAVMYLLIDSGSDGSNIPKEQRSSVHKIALSQEK